MFSSFFTHTESWNSHSTVFLDGVSRLGTIAVKQLCILRSNTPVIILTSEYILILIIVLLVEIVSKIYIFIILVLVITLTILVLVLTNRFIND